MCNQTTGWCLACDGGYAGDNCTACSPGWYGDQCDKECGSQMCLLDMCDQTTGLCLACKGGYAGDTCTVCLPGWYGDRCDIKCQSQSCLLDNSNKTTGWSVACAVFNDDVESSERQSIYVIVGAILSVGLLLIIAVVATICWLHRSKERKQESAAMPSSNFSDGSAHSNYYSLISDDHELRPLLNLNERPLPREHTSAGRTLANQASNVHTSTNDPDAESQYDSISVFSTSSSGSLLSSVCATDRSRYLHPIFNPTYSERLQGITST
ncbi:cell death abnormality protein 1-like [Littorina saxatilis]|uniref:cell death abnormality protein 1-like n=1 Tax=Littorina saxatilis TaxID=31220 RepID=UPI0038B584E4